MVVEYLNKVLEDTEGYSVRDEIELYMSWGVLTGSVDKSELIKQNSSITNEILKDLDIRSKKAQVIVSECKKLLSEDKLESEDLKKLSKFTAKLDDTSVVGRSKEELLQASESVIEAIHQNSPKVGGSEDFNKLIIYIEKNMGHIGGYRKRRSKQKKSKKKRSSKKRSSKKKKKSKKKKSKRKKSRRRK